MRSSSRTGEEIAQGQIEICNTLTGRRFSARRCRSIDVVVEPVSRFGLRMGRYLAWAVVLALDVHIVPGHTQVLEPAPQPEIRRPSAGGAWSAEVKPRRPTVARARATAIVVTGDATRSQVQLEVNRPIVASMFTLDEPYRAIIDVAELEFAVPPGTGTTGVGIVKAFRYGQFEAGRSRIVIDLAGPAAIQNAVFSAPTGNKPGVLSFELVRINAAEFHAMRGPADADAAARPPAQPQLRAGRHDEAARSGPSPGPQTASRKQRPVVVIDPGHGGIDPGTVSGTLTEKSVTLAVALQVRGILQQNRRYDVQMTRQGDTFLSLDQRVNISRQHGADLFVSIHADSIAETDLAHAVRGATVYILADRASDDAARRLAEKENAADVAAGLAAVPSSAEDQVRNILLDLVQRETANYAVTFRNLLLANMRGKVPLARDPQRSAAFRVLRQPETPAVLIELGYMTNAEDLARLGKAEGQRQLATSIATSIDAYFAKKDAQLNR